MLQFTAIFFQQAIQKGITKQHGDRPFMGRDKKLFAQIRSGKIIFYHCRALTKAWGDINKYHSKVGEEGSKKRKIIQALPFLTHGILKMPLEFTAH